MKNITFIYAQRGATLVIGLIMLTVITLLTISGFTMSGGNLQAVGNMQHRNEAIAAANMAIEQTINVNFAAIDPANYPEVLDIDIDQDNTTDYVVTINQPICIKSIPAPSNGLQDSNGVNSGIVASNDFLTLWEINVTSQNLATGTSVVAKQGINKRLTLAEATLSLCI